jgi:hypothetical protein
MQVFMPFNDIFWSISVLDKKRLWKQALEAREVIEILCGKDSKWVHHPVVYMYSGYIDFLCTYFNMCLEQCEIRGIKHKLQPYSIDYSRWGPKREIRIPRWMGYIPFHDSHLYNLVRKAYSNEKSWNLELRQRLVMHVGVTHDTLLKANQTPYIWTTQSSGELIPEIQEWLDNDRINRQIQNEVR